jgi:hypothetical protein
MLGLPACSKAEKAAEGQESESKVLEKTAEKGPVKLTVRLSPTAPRLSDVLTMEVVVEAALNVEIKPPPFGEGVGDFLVRDYSEKTAQVKNDVQTRRFVYALEPVFAGKHLIRSVSVEFTDKRANSESKGEPVLLETEPLEVTVISELGDATPNLANLTPMQAPLPIPPRSIWMWVALVVGLLAAGGLGVFLWERRQKKHEAVLRKRTPEEIAGEELQALLAQNLHGRGEFKEFYVRLTGIVRRYIEATTGIRALEETTEEFLREMRSRQVFPPERSLQLAQFLEAADMVKYAAQQPRERQIEDAISRAQEFVGLPSAFQATPAAGVK